MTGMANLLRTCKICSEEFDLLPGKPGLSTVCPKCSGPKQPDPKAVREATRQRKRDLIQNALNGEIKAKRDAIAKGKLGTAEECEKRILSLLKMKSHLG
jgi:hypothetical protein